MPETSSEYTVRPYRPGDEDKILPAFNRIFAEIDSTFVPRTMEEWRWRNQLNPAGLRIFVCTNADGEVVAHQAAIPVRLVHRGEPVIWNQIVDSFADPRHGKSLKRPGLFVICAKPFGDHYGGPPPKDQIMYGLPIRRAYRIGQKFLGYQTVREQLILEADPRQMPRADPGRTRIEIITRFTEEVAELFARACVPHAAIARRDAAFLNWRFADKPGADYHFALARDDGGRLLGYVVLSLGQFDLKESALVVDWLVDPAAPEAGIALRAYAGEWARARGADSLRALFPETCADFHAFQEQGYRACETAYITAAGSYTRAFHTLALFWGWYYTLAEFDLA
jgi:hypothetical protein